MGTTKYTENTKEFLKKQSSKVHQFSGFIDPISCGSCISWLIAGGYLLRGDLAFTPWD